MAAKIARTTAVSLAVVAFVTLGMDFAIAKGGGGHGGGRGGGGAHAAHVGGGHGRGIGRAHFSPSRKAVARVGGGHGRAYRNASVVAPRGITSGGAYSRSYRGFSRSASGRTFAQTGGAYGRAGIAAAGARAQGNWLGNPYARTGWRGGWGGWAGPVFWPYIYGNVLAYSLWPTGYYDPYSYDPFWGYGDIFVWNSMFWPGPLYAGPPIYDVYGAARYRDRRQTRIARPIDVDQLSACSGLAPGVTDLPIDRIAATVYPADEQLRELEALRAASLQASDVLKASCSNEVSLTPIGRLDAVQKRLDGMIQALAIVRTPLDNFYNSLTEDQRRRFETLGPTSVTRSRRVAATGSANDLVALCARRAEGFTQLPVQRVEQIVQPTPQQQEAFSRLKTASSDAANILQASCPSQTPQTTLDRFDAVDKRLNAMSGAVKVVRPALEGFYLSLSDEQKARFNTLGPPSPQG